MFLFVRPTIKFTHPNQIAEEDTSLFRLCPDLVGCAFGAEVFQFQRERRVTSTEQEGWVGLVGISTGVGPARTPVMPLWRPEKSFVEANVSRHEPRTNTDLEEGERNSAMAEARAYWQDSMSHVHHNVPCVSWMSFKHLLNTFRT